MPLMKEMGTETAMVVAVEDPAAGAHRDLLLPTGIDGSIIDVSDGLPMV